VETDSPYLSPQSRRGKPNEPANVAETATVLAEQRGTSYEQLEAVVEHNARMAREVGLLGPDLW
jgi:TatD DNase family protein